MSEDEKFNFEKILQKRLVPLAVSNLEELMLDEDKKIRMQATEDVLDMAGKRKRGNSSGGITLNLGSLVEGLRKIGGKKDETISEEGVKKIAPKRTVQKRK